jgi:hypothetical protein
MLELKFSTFVLESIIQLQCYANIYYIYNLLKGQEVLGFDIIFVVIGGLILFSINVININSILIHSASAAKKGLKNIGKALTSLGTGAYLYTGGK